MNRFKIHFHHYIVPNLSQKLNPNNLKSVNKFQEKDKSSKSVKEYKFFALSE